MQSLSTFGVKLAKQNANLYGFSIMKGYKIYDYYYHREMNWHFIQFHLERRKIRMYYIVDRIEGAFAVCETPERKMIDIPLSKLPVNIKAGDFITKNEQIYEIDSQKTKEHNEIILQKMKNLWK